MPDTTEQANRELPRGSRWKRVGWFLALYLAGLTAVTLIAAALRGLMELGFG